MAVWRQPHQAMRKFRSPFGTWAPFRSPTLPFCSCEMGFGLWNFRITWCGCLQMAITSSFQLQFMHHLKRWTPNFLSFETTYSRNEMDSREYSKYVQQLLSSWILHVRFLCFSSLHPWFGFGKGLQSSKAWILHVNGLPFAFPWIL